MGARPRKARRQKNLGDRFREHLLDVENKGSDLSFQSPRPFTHKHMEICGINLHLEPNKIISVVPVTRPTQTFNAK